MKTQQNGENLNSISEHWLRGLQLGRAMNWADRLCTSADDWLLSWWCSVVIVWWAAVGCDCFALTRRCRRTNLVEGRRHYHFERRSAELSWRQVGLLTQLLQYCRSSCWASHAVAAVLSFQACLRACICTYCMCVCICVYVCVCMNMHICIYLHVYMYRYTHASIYLCICMCMHVCA